jgi:serine protease inhibitor
LFDVPDGLQQRHCVLGAVAAAGSAQNVVVSPYRVSAALTMVDVGAAGETATQMQTVLHLPDSRATQ